MLWKVRFFFGGGQLCAATKTRFHKFRVRRLGVFSVEHHGVNIAAAVGKCRKDKTCVRSADHPVADARTDTVLVLAVAKSRLGQSDRADRTQQILVDFLGFVELIVVGGLGHHIVSIVENQNQVISGIAVIFNDKIIECVHQIVIL